MSSLGIGKLPSEFLAGLLDAHPVVDPSVIIGPGVGMDAAAVDPAGDLIVVKTDPITFARERAPLYLVNVNANDLACLGATPRWLLVTALFPAGQTTETMVSELFTELNAVCAARSIALIGGHTEITEGLDRVILVGQLLGTVKRDAIITPGGAKPSDRVLLTRPAAIEGTALLAIELRSQLQDRVGSELLDRASALLDHPGISVADDARILASTGCVTALHDPTEGGIATGVRELALSANAGAIISRRAVPLLDETRIIADALGLDPLGMLASGSLLATVPAMDVATVEQACSSSGMPFAWIGKILPPDRGLLLRSDTGEDELPAFNTDEVARALAAARM